MVDGRLCRDVRTTTVSFTGHRVLQPRENEAQVRGALERLLLERIVEHVNGCLARMSLGEVSGAGICAGLSALATGASASLNDPEVYLHHLCKFLDSHRELLKLEASAVRVNRIGEIVPADSKQLANDLQLYEMCLGGDALGALALVTYPREEMLSSDELLRRATAGLQY